VHELTLTEAHLAALCLDAVYIGNEFEVASVKFFEALKKRGVTIADFASDWPAVRTIRGPISFFELQALAQRLGCCPICHHKTL
jgi:hypothetical protein